MEKTIQLIPLYSLLLIFSSFIATSDYYSRFGIDIYNYIEFGDLLMISLPIFKNIFFAIFTVFSMSFTSFITGYMQAMFSSPRKKIAKGLIEKLRKNSNTAIVNPHVGLRQRIWDIEQNDIGFHLITETIEMFQYRYRKNFTKSELWGRGVTLFLITFGIGFLCYYFGSEWIDYYKSVKNGYQKFYQRPNETIAYLIIIPISIILVLSSVLGGRFLWKAFYSRFFKMEFMPFILIIIFTVTSLLSNYADYLYVTKEKVFGVLKVYQDGSLSSVSSVKQKYIGRTKSYLFLLAGQNVKCINISDADSIIVSVKNRIK